MAQILLGPLVANIAGSMAGSTFQRGNGQNFVRRKPIPILRRSKYTNAHRAMLSYLSRTWRSLTPEDRDAWAAAAASVTWHDRFGNVIPGRGYWLYNRLNINLSLVGEPFTSTPFAPASQPPITDLSLTLVEGAKYAFSWSGPSPIPSGFRWLISATLPMSPGLAAPFSAFRVITFLDEGTFPTADLFTEYTARFKSLGRAGQLSWLRVTPIHYKSGTAGAPTQVSAIWA